MINQREINRACKLALKSVLTAAENGFAPMSDTWNECRLALSLLDVGEPSAAELEPFLGPKWAICRATKANRERFGRCLTPTDYRLAEIKALAKRLNLSERFIGARLLP